MQTHPNVSRIEDRIIERIDAAMRELPPRKPPNHPRSPRSCWFASGEVTPAMVEHAERVSVAWRNRIFR